MLLPWAPRNRSPKPDSYITCAFVLSTYFVPVVGLHTGQRKIRNPLLAFKAPEQSCLKLACISVAQREKQKAALDIPNQNLFKWS